MTEYFGIGSLQNLRKLIAGKSVFLVTGNRSYDLIRQRLEPLLQGSNVTRFCEVSENPKLAEIKKGMDEFRKRQFDIVIAIGGGSVIDCAKLINIFSFQVVTSLDILIKKIDISKKGLPLIAIPTTAGSGSEATCFAVVYHRNRKYSIDHPFLLPEHAILDSVFTYTLPEKTTAATGMDALCQAIESYWSVRSNEVSKSYSKIAIKLIVENLEKAVNSPDPASRQKMLKAANLAGKAINITRTTAPHALSYAITTKFKIPHGHAVALTLPKFIVFNSEVTPESCNDPRGVAEVKKKMNEICRILGANTSADAADKIRSLLKNIRLEPDLKNITQDFEFIARKIDLDRLGNNPRKIAENELINLLANYGTLKYSI